MNAILIGIVSRDIEFAEFVTQITYTTIPSAVYTHLQLMYDKIDHLKRYGNLCIHELKTICYNVFTFFGVLFQSFYRLFTRFFGCDRDKAFA